MLPISANSKKMWESIRIVLYFANYELGNYKTASMLNLRESLSSWQQSASETVTKIVNKVQENSQKIR